MVDVIIMCVSLVVTAVGTICVPVCMRTARNDVVEHVVVVNEVPLEFDTVESSKDSSLKYSIASSYISSDDSLERDSSK